MALAWLRCQSGSEQVYHRASSPPSPLRVRKQAEYPINKLSSPEVTTISTNTHRIDSQVALFHMFHIDYTILLTLSSVGVLQS